MCRTGGRRCPSHSDPVAIAARNARRRAIYAQNKQKSKGSAFGKTGNDFLDKLLAGEHEIVPPEKKTVKNVPSATVKMPPKKKTTKANSTNSGNKYGVKPLFEETQAEKDSAAKLVDSTIKEGTIVEPGVEKKEFELLDMEELESSDTAVLYGGESVSLQTNNGQGSSGWHTKSKEYSNDELFFNKGLKKYNPDLNVEISENEGYLVDTHYLSSKKVSGVLDYTKLSEIDDSELGFNKMSKDGEDYELKNKEHTHIENYYELSRKEMAVMSEDDKIALRYFTSENYKWLNQALFNKETVKNEEFNYDKYDSFKDFVRDTEYKYEHKNVDSVKKVSKALDEALAKAPKKQKVLYRGVNKYAPMYGSSSPEEWVNENYAVGKEVVFDGYQSSSANPSPALNFSSHGGIIYEILTPEGANVSSESEYDSEAEITLPRAQRYTVSSIHKKDISTGSMTYNGVTIVRLIAVNSKGEVLDGTNSEKPADITDDYFTKLHKPEKY